MEVDDSRHMRWVYAVDTPLQAVSVKNKPEALIYGNRTFLVMRQTTCLTRQGSVVGFRGIAFRRNIFVT